MRALNWLVGLLFLAILIYAYVARPRSARRCRRHGRYRCVLCARTDRADYWDTH